jgi:hypothetical protein
VEIEPIQSQHPFGFLFTLAQNFPSFVPSDFGMGLFLRIDGLFGTEPIAECRVFSAGSLSPDTKSLLAE